MRLGLVLVLACLGSSNAALAAAGRSLPKVMTALVVEKTFSAPGGELQFLVGGEGHTIYYRTAENALYGHQETHGPRDCDEYVARDDKEGERLPAGCEFVLKDFSDDKIITVRSEELREGGQIFRDSARVGEKPPYVAL